MVTIWRSFLLRPGKWRVVAVAVVTGLAIATKFSLLVLLPVMIALAIAQPRCRLSHAAIGTVLLFLVLNAVYLFHGTGRQLGSYEFLSKSLTGDQFGRPANRFRGTVIEGLPLPLPSDFVTGLDLQKSHNDYAFYNYFCGEWKHGGWWYYYLAAALVKIPLGTWLLGIAALVLICFRHFRASLLDEALIWLPPLAILVLVSSQTGINGHFRYALPALPFVFIGISRVGRLFEFGSKGPGRGRGYVRMAAAAGIAGCLIWNAAETLRYHPHHLSYFNQIAGGPDNGWKWLAESNIDWGQDLLLLKEWLDQHPEATASMQLAYYGGVPPHLLGVKGAAIQYQYGPQPGWYAVSVNALVGMAFSSRYPEGGFIHYPLGAFRYFEHFTPMAKAGYSIFIYHITLEEANEVRRNLGLSPLPP
jgi:hypothetical protein